MIAIAPFLAGDEEDVAGVILPIQQAEFEIPITLADQPDLSDIEGFYRRGAGNFWIARDDGLAVGTIALFDMGGGEGALRKMFVRREYRGRGHDVAGSLLRTLLEWCSRRGIRRVFLGTTAKFLAAQRFYEKTGFVEIAKADLPPSFPLMSVDTKFYTLVLESDEAASA